jgi:hypothetical protein
MFGTCWNSGFAQNGCHLCVLTLFLYRVAAGMVVFCDKRGRQQRVSLTGRQLSVVPLLSSLSFQMRSEFSWEIPRFVGRSLVDPQANPVDGRQS